MAPGLNYGQQCYEGLKAFRTPDDSAITIFRPSMNAKRMQHSASFVSMPEVPVEHFENCVKAAVALNAEFVPPARTGAAMYIRPLLFGSSAQLGLSPPEEYTFVVWVLPVGVYHGVHSVPALILEDFDRAAPHGTGSAKVGGNYAPVLRFSERARADGFGITLHLDSRTRTEIDEFSTSAFLGVKKEGEKTTIVVPDSKNVIESVTADSVCDIARSFGWTVEKRAVSPVCISLPPISPALHTPPSPSSLHSSFSRTSTNHSSQINYDELSTFNEVFAAGTAAALVPIKSITMKSRNDTFTYLDSDEPGPTCLKLLDNLKGIQTGRYEDKFGWNVKVEQVQRSELEGEARDETKGGNVDKMP